MGQRKEKYMRRALVAAVEAREIAEVVNGSVNQAHRRIDAVVRDVQQLRDDQVRLTRSTRRRRRYDDRANQLTVRIAMAALLLALVALTVAIVCARVEAGKRAEAMKAAQEAPQKTETQVVIIPTTEVMGAMMTTMTPLPAAEVILEPVYLSEAIPLSYDLQTALWDACEATGVPYTLALAVIEKESNFRNVAGDGGTSLGYMQVRPSCHWDRMERLGITDLWDPAGNFMVGCDYLAEMLAKTDTTAEALMAYNMGYFGASKLWKEGVRASEYSTKVQAYADAWGETLGS